MKKSKSLSCYITTLLGSILTAIMVVLDAIYFPLETDQEPDFYFVYFFSFIAITLLGIILSFFFRDKESVSSKEKYFAYSSLLIGLIIFLFSASNIDKYLLLGAIGFGLIVIGISSFLSTEARLIVKKADKTGEKFIYKAFPQEIRNDVTSVIKWLKSHHQIKLYSVFQSTVLFSEFDNVFVPKRVKFEDIEEYYDLNSNSIMIYWCLQTSNFDGRIREKYIRLILDKQYPSWAIPFIIEASTDYVVEIVDSIYGILKNRPDKRICDYYTNNLSKFRYDFSKTISYWNCYYRSDYPNYRDYPGYKLFIECYKFQKRYYK